MKLGRCKARAVCWWPSPGGEGRDGAVDCAMNDLDFSSARHSISSRNGMSKLKPDCAFAQ